MKTSHLLLLLMLLLSSVDSFALEQTRNRIVGSSGDGQSWAYEFLENQTSGKPSILDNPSGAVVFQNPEWIVMASEASSNVGNRKTDLFFYDARSLKQIASARIPNKVIKVGAIGSAFYMVTITPAKYKYDDAPFAICLIDPKTKDIERIKLVEKDYWLAWSAPGL